ncbi:hypothetical protein MVEN_02396000 [Mycena venus]|uniref:F-box domain-containing protein n=1 Tax=Mycena venus TaxID=2733690 RepID=A0A8H7CD78_9AGAR|nr:hypothetical protein MVEN_02396000 [Mycena venus]
MSLSKLALPHELWDAILDHLHDDRAALRAAALVCRTWVPTTRFHLFEDISLSPKCTARAACLNALLMSPYATIAPAVRKLALPGALVPIQIRGPNSVSRVIPLLGLVPGLARLPHLTELELSDFPLCILHAWQTVERLTLTSVCAGVGLLRVVQELPHLIHLTLEEVTAVPYRGGGCTLENGIRKIAIRGSSLAFLGWLSLAAPHVVSVSVDTLVGHELHYLAEYLSGISATVQELELSFFDLDPLNALALPRLLAPCENLKILRLQFAAANDVRHFFAFGSQGPWLPSMRLEIAIQGPLGFEDSNELNSLEEFFRDWCIDMRVVCLT